MIELAKTVEKLSQQEYFRASKQHGKVNYSDHESYSVILEELQEAEEDILELRKRLENFWNLVKANSDDYTKSGSLAGVYSSAILGACELIQVAAMAHKANITIAERGEL